MKENKKQIAKKNTDHNIKEEKVEYVTAEELEETQREVERDMEMGFWFRAWGI